MAEILVVDDELSIRQLLTISLEESGHRVSTTENGERALALLKRSPNRFELLITDLKMEKLGGLELIKEARAINAELPLIVMTAYASMETAVEAMRCGAYDYITKPFQLDELELIINKALERSALINENRSLRASLRGQPFPGLIGESPAMQEVFHLIARYAQSEAPVLIEGESGTGKELVARAIHDRSQRSGPFVAFNCAAVPETLLESELFGHQAEAFSGATRDRVGLFQAANGGTLFLDEIGEMPLSMQVKLLRVLQEQKVKRVGDWREQPVDLRVIAATNRSLLEEVREARFRHDLFYRISVLLLQLPPLRERRGDLPLLAAHILGELSLRSGGRAPRILSDAALQHLESAPLKGNVRELKNLIERAYTLCEGAEILPAILRYRPRAKATWTLPSPSHRPLLPRKLRRISFESSSIRSRSTSSSPKEVRGL